MQPAELIEQLKEDISVASELLALMEPELTALKERDLPSLETLLAQKQPLLATLDAHRQQRSQFLQQAGLTANPHDLAQLLAAHQQSHLVGQLETLLDACKTANERNGRLIHLNKSAIEKMLNILLHGNAESAKIYDKYGSTAQRGRQRPLSQA